MKKINLQIFLFIAILFTQGCHTAKQSVRQASLCRNDVRIVKPLVDEKPSSDAWMNRLLVPAGSSINQEEFDRKVVKLQKIKDIREFADQSKIWIAGDAGVVWFKNSYTGMTPTEIELTFKNKEDYNACLSSIKTVQSEDKRIQLSGSGNFKIINADRGSPNKINLGEVMVNIVQLEDTTECKMTDSTASGLTDF